MSGDKLKKETITGISWSLASQVVIQASTFIIGLILVKLLEPEDFGLMSMVVVITGFANVFKSFGLGSAIIHDQTIDQNDLSTIFWFNLLIGFCLTVLIFLSKGLISSFYNQPDLIPIVSIISLNFFITSFNIVQFSLLRKKLDFKKIFIVQTIATLLSGGLAIFLASKGAGVWSLVWKTLCFSSALTILFWILHDWKPSFTFRKKSLNKAVGFGLPLMASESFNYWVRNIDNLLIGKYWGGSQLGFYDRSYQLMLLPVNNMSAVIGSVLFPSFSKIQEDHKRVSNIFRLSAGGVSLIVMPMMIGLFITAEYLVISLFGQKWLPMVPVLKILSLLGISQSIIHLTSTILLSQGKTKLILKLGLVTKTFTILMIVLGLKNGIVGVATNYLIANLITSPLILYVTGRLINLPYWSFLKDLFPIFFSAVLMGVTLHFLNQYLITVPCSSFQMLYIDIIAGIFIYTISVYITNPPALNYILSFAKKIKI